MFEASEKKLEIVVSKQHSSLRLLPEDFWRKVIRACGAEIVSLKKYKDIDSYILSESSLFYGIGD